MTIREAVADDHDTLVDIWLRSVKATHTFLTEQDIHALLPEVRHALDKLELWVLCSGQYAIGFLGLAGSKVEALFFAPESLRLGGGRMLLDHARRLKGPPDGGRERAKSRGSAVLPGMWIHRNRAFRGGW